MLLTLLSTEGSKVKIRQNFQIPFCKMLKNKYCLSLNSSRGWLFLFSHQKGRYIHGKTIIRGRRLFQIVLTLSRALNTLFYFSIKLKNNHIKQTEHWHLKCSKFGSLINFQCQCPRCQSLNCLWSVLLDQTPLLLYPPSLPPWVSLASNLQGWGRGDYFKRIHQREAIKRGTAIIWGNTVVPCENTADGNSFEW